MTPKQQRFVEEYLIDLNATQAAIRAGYSEKTAGKIGFQLLEKTRVAEAIQRAQGKRSRRAMVTQDDVLRELARLGFSDLRRIFNEDGSLKQPHEWDDDTAAAIASVEVFEEYEGKGEDRRLSGYTRKVKVWDKNSALEKLGKHLGILGDQLTVKVTGELVTALALLKIQLPPDEYAKVYEALTARYCLDGPEGEAG